MPELPEVESTRRHIEPSLRGRMITSVEVGRDRMARRNERPSDVVDRLEGRSVAEVGRIGKFIVSEVEGDFRWVIHLGMSGRLQLSAPHAERVTHTNVVVGLEGNVELRFVDPRTFGFVAVFTPDEWDRSPMVDLGRDALWDPPDGEWLADRFIGRKAAIKGLLLDQRIVAGIGNIYADEMLHRARVRPDRPAGSLDRTEVDALAATIRPVMEDGLAFGGTSLDDLAYLLPDGRVGEYLSRLAVYGRTGEACPRCGGVIERVVVAQRSAHFCPTCQR